MEGHRLVAARLVEAQGLLVERDARVDGTPLAPLGQLRRRPVIGPGAGRAVAAQRCLGLERSPQVDQPLLERRRVVEAESGGTPQHVRPRSLLPLRHCAQGLLNQAVGFGVIAAPPRRLGQIRQHPYLPLGIRERSDLAQRLLEGVKRLARPARTQGGGTQIRERVRGDVTIAQARGDLAHGSQVGSGLAVSLGAQ